MPFENVIFVPFSSFGCLASSSSSGQLGVIPEKVNPIWAAEPFLTLLAENGIIDTTAQPAATDSLDIKVIDNYILFEHPLDKHQVRLPGNYAGAVLTICGKTYQMPPVNMLKKNGVYTDLEQSKDDFWN